MADNDIARRGYMHVVRNPKDGVVSYFIKKKNIYIYIYICPI